MAELVWMRHGEHGGVAGFSVDSLDPWRALGWSECDAPVDPDPAMAEHVARFTPGAAEIHAEPADLIEDAQKSPASTETEE